MSPDKEKSKIHIFFLLAVVLFICVDYFGVCCQVLELSAVEMSAFTPI